MAMHGRHTGVPVGRLDPKCDECAMRRIHQMDDKHIETALGLRRADLETICEVFPQLRDVIWNAPALSVQGLHDYIVRNGWQPLYTVHKAERPPAQARHLMNVDMEARDATRA